MMRPILQKRPTRIRWHIVVLLMAICFISHFNRVSMSVAGNDRIMGQFAIEPTKMGKVYSVFLLVYSICMIPGGVFIDRFGPRRALMLVGFGSAVFGALTGVTGWLMAGSAGVWMSLLVVRGSMGLLSAPLHPAAARAVGNWFPPGQRSLANGIVTGAAIAGVAITYPGFGALIQFFDWPTAFLVSAVVTMLITATWMAYATDDPWQHPRCNDAERNWIQRDPRQSGNDGDQASSGWRGLLQNRS